MLSPRVPAGVDHERLDSRRVRGRLPHEGKELDRRRALGPTEAHVEEGRAAEGRDPVRLVGTTQGQGHALHGRGEPTGLFVLGGEVPPGLSRGVARLDRQGAERERAAPAAGGFPDQGDAVGIRGETEPVEGGGAREEVRALVGDPGLVSREQRGHRRPQAPGVVPRRATPPGAEGLRGVRGDAHDPELVAEPPHPDRPAPEHRPVAEEVQARVGVADEGHRLGEGRRDRGVAALAGLRPQRDQAPPIGLAGLGSEAPVVGQELAEGDVRRGATPRPGSRGDPARAPLRSGPAPPGLPCAPRPPGFPPRGAPRTGWRARPAGS